jgi:aryl-alcohol dehydrogenase-like predicted oxidoreductase
MPLSITNRPDESKAIDVVHQALDAGMTWIDTADVYCVDHTDIGHGERLVAKALSQWSGNKDDVLVITKGGLERPNGDWVTNGRPEHLQRACEASMKALETDCIPVYQLHAPDSDVPFAESVGALKDLQDEGKIECIGLSNVNVTEIQIAQQIVDVASVQNRCNPFDRNSFLNGVVDYCTKQDIAFLAHSPVGGHRDHFRNSQSPVMNRIAERREMSTYQVCLVWLMAQSPIVLPIPGASRSKSAMSSAAAGDMELPPEDLAELSMAFPTRHLG